MDDREINAQLAEHLMGWRVDRGSRPWTCHDGTGIVATIGEGTSYPHFAPATTGDGMLMVIEAMHKLDREVGENYYLVLVYTGENSGWAASFWLSIGNDDPVWYDRPWDYPQSAGADTAPKAVALAALKALGVEVA